MAPRTLKVGKIIDKTLGVIERGAGPALVFIAGVTAITGTITYLTVHMTAPLEAFGVWLTTFIVSISAAYLLIDALLRRTGLITRTSDDVFVPYMGLSVLYALGTMAGFIVFILPGLWIMARWVIAQPMLIARGTGIKEALGQSWEDTNGAEFQIIGAALALLALPLGTMLGAALLFEQGSATVVFVSQLASSAVSVISLSMGVTIYGMLETAKGAAGQAG